MFLTLSVIAFTALWIVGKQRNRLVAVTAFSHPSSVVDEAARMLSRRYARGAVSADEYEKMMAILRR